VGHPDILSKQAGTAKYVWWSKRFTPPPLHQTRQG
jgi:hypothetical protein